MLDCSRIWVTLAAATGLALSMGKWDGRTSSACCRVGWVWCLDMEEEWRQGLLFADVGWLVAGMQCEQCRVSDAFGWQCVLVPQRSVMADALRGARPALLDFAKATHQSLPQHAVLM
jgi:hypothetical protein